MEVLAVHDYREVGANGLYDTGIPVREMQRVPLSTNAQRRIGIVLGMQYSSRPLHPSSVRPRSDDWWSLFFDAWFSNL